MAANSGQESGPEDLETGRIHSNTCREITSVYPTALWNSQVNKVTDRIREKLPSEEIDSNVRKPYIMRVVPNLRNVDNEAYEPKLVSIGPLHHGNPRLLSMEKVKLEYVRALLQRHPTNSLQNYVSTIFSYVGKARSEYSEDINFSDEEFVEMLVVDGCFILECFARHFSSKFQRTTAQVRLELSWMWRDLMLLENQVPFFVLTKISDNTTVEWTKETGKKIVSKDLISQIFCVILPPEKHPQPDKVHHLLHFNHLSEDPKCTVEEPRSLSCRQMAMFCANRLLTVIFLLPVLGLFYLIVYCCGPAPSPESNAEISQEQRNLSATELLEAGINIKRKIYKTKFQKSCQLKVSFKNETLEIPKLRVDDGTNVRLRNLIAFEQCYSQGNTYFTDYCLLMHRIMKTADDVRILRKYGILESLIRSDSVVVELFENLGKEVYVRGNGGCYADLYKAVGKVSAVPHHKWRTYLRKKYYSNPWTFLSVLAGLLLLFLALIQTVFTILSWKNQN